MPRTFVTHPARVPRKREKVVAVIVTLLLCACQNDDRRPAPQAARDNECLRPVPRSGNEFDLREEANFPCVISFEPTGTSLRGRYPDVPDPGLNVVVDSRGRFVTSVASGGGFAVWSPNGDFIRHVGKVGQGPGEFSDGWVTLYVDSTDNILARDNSSNWLIFDSTLTFLRSLRVRSAGAQNYSHLIGGQKLLSSWAPGRPPAHYFEIISIAEKDSALRVPFGPVSESDREGGRAVRRITSYISGGEFWAAPAVGSSDGYQLEKWSIDGEILRVIKRPVRWFEESVETSKRGPPASAPPPPVFSHMQAAANGLLFVVIRVPGETWRPIEDPDQAEQKSDSLFDWRYDLIDSEAGVVLAAGLSDRFRDVPRGFFSNTLDGFLIAFPDSNVVRMVSLHLRATRR